MYVVFLTMLLLMLSVKPEPHSLQLLPVPGNISSLTLCMG